jgi:hypothetical protein
MTDGSHERVMRTLADVVTHHDWDRLGDAVTDDSVLEFPQSGEVFRGLANVRAQFERYPDMEPGTSVLNEVVGGTQYALSPAYTIVEVDGTANRGTAIIRVRYPDGSHWWAINVYELRGGKISRNVCYFAPDFEAPDWRAPYREAP